MVKVYGIKNCDSVKKAIKFFDAHAIEYTLYNFKIQSVGCDEISSWLEHVEMKQLFNARSTTYRTLKLKELQLDEAGQREWLCKENLLIKRPVVEYDGKVLVGFKEEIYKGEFL